jgi:hypothetical protein
VHHALQSLGLRKRLGAGRRIFLRRACLKDASSCEKPITTAAL